MPLFTTKLVFIVNVSLSVSLPWYQESIWDPWPDFYYWQTVAALLMWGVFSEERTGLYFTIAVGSHQCSHSRVRVPRDSRSYFSLFRLDAPPTWRDSVPYLYPPTTGVSQFIYILLQFMLSYNWPSVGQSILESGSHLGAMTRLSSCLTIASFLTWDTLSEERIGL
jgi:hypothetical protein